ncbi:MAG: DUF4091 domain-containing protein [Planctomycetes bacterium]|nr:DUF4091 domain-containing protein [Planctomycetota bacterium]
MTTRLTICFLTLAGTYAWAAGGPATRPALEAADYGQLILANDNVAVWWCEAMRKVGRTRPAPREGAAAASLSAAKNEFEAVQIVVRPDKPLAALRCRATDLEGPNGSRIPAGNISLLRVAYVPVTAPTDSLGQAGDWPDPLPPLDGPIDVPAGVNQPIWVLVHVPRDAAASDYLGRIELSANGWSAHVPISLHVWDFALPDKPRTASALGLSMGNAYRYQAAKTSEQHRQLFAKYMQCFADHRISPYNPVPFDPIDIKFVPDAQPPRADVTFDRFDAAMAEAIDRWHITSFNLHLPGMGGGTFHQRHEGQIADFKAGSPQFEALFSSMVRQIESHLRDKGWLDLAYVYWFDEPEPRDYEFVRAGMDRIKKYAPGIRRMLTEQPTEPLFGAVDLWCPILDAFKPDEVRRRQALGEQFWWYICTGPKAPYCTEFIDHPATSLRAWLWQTWQHQVSGILIWETTYWTSGTAFPDSLQDPYRDAMSYVSGYGTPAGTKKPWGNGDGRFIYPPESAAEGATHFVPDGPVSSIRWEMLRDGIEDLDYCYLLTDAHAARGNKDSRIDAPADISARLTSYTFDPAPIYRQRQRVAEMIERIVRER